MTSTLYYGGDKMSKMFEDGVTCLHNSAALIYKCLGDILDVYSCKADDNPFVIADFGTGDASVGLPLFNAIIDQVQRKLGTDKEIVLILEDQPRNDFNALFSVLNGVDCNHEKAPLLREQVTILVKAGCMYKKCLPPNYVDFAVTSSSIHLLSSLPCHIKRGVTYINADEEENKKFKTRAEEDWKNFVMNRGKELKPGGKLVILHYSKDGDEKIIGQVVGGLHTLTKIAEQLLSEKYITQEEFTSMTYPGFFDMYEDDLRKIFFQDDTEMQKIGLKLDYLQHKRTTHISGLSSEESNDEAKKKLYAHRVAELHKLVLYSSIHHGLCTDRSELERRKLADLYFDKLEDFAFNAHTQPPAVVPYVEIIISKRCSKM